MCAFGVECQSENDVIEVLAKAIEGYRRLSKGPTWVAYRNHAR